MNLRLYTCKSLLHGFLALGSPPADRSLLCCHCRTRDSQDCPFSALRVLCHIPKMLYCVPTLYLTSSELATVFCLAPMPAIHISTSHAVSVLGDLGEVGPFSLEAECHRYEVWRSVFLSPVSSKATGLTMVSRNHHKRSTQGQVNEESSHCQVADSLGARGDGVASECIFSEVTNGPAVEQKG